MEAHSLRLMNRIARNRGNSAKISLYGWILLRSVGNSKDNGKPKPQVKNEDDIKSKTTTISTSIDNKENAVGQK